MGHDSKRKGLTLPFGVKPRTVIVLFGIGEISLL